jgi:protein-tyrosine phosphatase
MANNRYYRFDGVSNFRDVGGLQTAGGTLTKSGMLFRSDELSKLSDDDLVRFDLLEIKTICDLRTPKERKSRLDRLPVKCNISVINIPLSDQNREANLFQFLFYLTTKKNKIDFERYIREHYYRNAFERTAQINQVFGLLGDRNNYPALIHCTVGKDRTGLISALVQLLCGVARNDVIDDYLLTNKYIESRILQITKFIRRISLYRMSAEQIRPLLEARPEYLDDIISLILNKYKTIENYLLSACKIPPDVLTNIKIIFTE